MIDSFALGDAVAMKKAHPCGVNQWTIIRVGADVKIKCQGCGRVVMLPRQEFISKASKLMKTEVDNR